DVDAHLDKLFTSDQKKQFTAKPQGSGDGGFGPSSQPGQVLASPDQDRLKLTDDQKKDLAALQKAIDDRLDKVLNAAQQKQLKSAFAPGGPGPGGPGPAAPGGATPPGNIL